VSEVAAVLSIYGTAMYLLQISLAHVMRIQQIVGARKRHPAIFVGGHED
jgi:hypothetical protein